MNGLGKSKVFDLEELMWFEPEEFDARLLIEIKNVLDRLLQVLYRFGFGCISNLRINRRGGGSLIIHRNSLNAKQIAINNCDNDHQHSIAECASGKKTFILCSAYIPPKSAAELETPAYSAIRYYPLLKVLAEVSIKYPGVPIIIGVDANLASLQLSSDSANYKLLAHNSFQQQCIADMLLNLNTFTRNVNHSQKHPNKKSTLDYLLAPKDGVAKITVDNYIQSKDIRNHLADAISIDLNSTNINVSTHMMHEYLI